MTTAVVSVVDDDAFVRTATMRLVASHGFVARGFASAEDFLRSPDFGDTACLITDMRMPGMSGSDLRRHLVATGKAIPTIFITAYQDETSLAGAAGFLTKPFDGQALIDCIARALRNRPDTRHVP